MVVRNQIEVLKYISFNIPLRNNGCEVVITETFVVMASVCGEVGCARVEPTVKTLISTSEN